ncbi:MAG: AMP-binding protein [Prevotella sp.]|nr:AMP-binding protein [Prevotella sp.]
MLNKFLEKEEFSSYEDFMQGFKVKVPENFNFGYDVVDAWAKAVPEKEALLWANDKGDIKHVTYGAFKNISDQCAAFFQGIGIEKGDRVMLILKRRVEWWYAMVALHKIGAVAIPATHMLTDKDIMYRCHMAGITCIVSCGDPIVLGHVQKARRFCPMLRHCISIGPLVPNGFYDFWRGLQEAAPLEEIKRNKVTDNFLLYFTSGTTGEPKMVMHDYSYPLAHIVTAKYWHNLNDESLHLTLADTGWGKAAWGKFYGQMIAGATVFVYDYEGHFKPADLLKVMQDFKITSFCAPPTIYRFLVRENIEEYDLSSLKWCTTAGEPLNPSVFEKWHDRTSIIIREAYGQTETTMVVGTYPWVTPKPGAMGLRNPQYDIDVIDDKGNSVAPMEQGELVIKIGEEKTLGLFKKYYRNEEMTEHRIVDGKYHTGDVVYYDQDGYFWFVSRIDDVIKTSGYRVGPFEVESALMTHPAVLECAVTAVPDDLRGQIVKATIVLNKEYKEKASDSLVKELQAHVKRETAPYKYPRIIDFVDELPKTISGKVQRAVIRKVDSK